MNADDLIAHLGLTPLGFEGGYYKETYRGPDSVATAIFYMLTPDTCSLMHRLEDPEMYHFYLGDPVEMLMLHEDGSAEIVHIGPDVANGHRVQHLVPARVWQGSRLIPGGRFALMGTTMTPGFDLARFRLGSRDDLSSRCPPEHAELLTALTPERIATERLELAAGTLDLMHADRRGPEILAAGLNAEVPADWPPQHYDDQARDYVIERLARGREQRGWWTWFLVLRSPRVVIGSAGYKGPPENGEVEIGYSVVDSFQKNGFATEAARALVEHAFADPRVNRVAAEALPDGVASIRVLEKCGFAREREQDGVVRFVKVRSR